MHIYGNVLETIGRTPLVELGRLCALRGLKARVAAKLESRNPGGSAKDRVAVSMLEDARASGRIAPGATVIEPTSGNTGVGLAMAAASMGYRLILTMPDTMSAERRGLLRAYGARLVLTDGALGMAGAIARAKELAASIPGSFLPGQFENPANPAAHYAATGPEIWADTEGELTAFVAAVGTGGTLTGVGRYLKEKNPAVRVVGVEPAESAVLSGGQVGPHGIEGIGAGFVPRVLDRKVADEVLPVRTEDARAMARLLARTEGVLAGVSSGAALCAACALAERAEYEGKRIVVLLPDTGERYLSTPLFSEAEHV